jgi:cell division protein FtsB
VKALRLLLVVLLLMLGWLQYTLWLGSGGQRQVAALKQRVAAQESENLRLRQRNDALAAEVEDLKSGEAAVEERARSELGMVKPGETFYRVVDDAPASRPAAASAPPEPARR